jgi:hypothetical protein
MADRQQRRRNQMAKAGEGDRVILTKMPKHLFSGKRSNGKTGAWRASKRVFPLPCTACALRRPHATPNCAHVLTRASLCAQTGAERQQLRGWLHLVCVCTCAAWLCGRFCALCVLLYHCRELRRRSCPRHRHRKRTHAA